MLKYLNILNKNIAVLALILLGALLFTPNFAYAQLVPTSSTPGGGLLQDIVVSTGIDKAAGSIFNGLLSVAGKGISFLVFGINYIIGFIGAVAFALGGVLLQLGLELNARLILSPVVRTGWVITRDIANLGFVVAIIVIAFATMLRLETYNAKKALTTLIMVALLINFSLTFAGVLVDATGIISNFFIREVTPGNLNGINKFAENLASIFQLQQLQKVKDLTDLPQFGNLSEFSASMLGLVASIFFVALFTVIGAAVMLMIAGLIIIRYIALSLLLIIMPLALVAFIFPNLRDRGRTWVKKFTEWLMFMPVTLFFLYLTMLMVSNFKTDPNSIVFISKSMNAANAGIFTKFLTPIADAVQIFTQMIVVLGMLIGGLIVAKSFSLEFSNGIIGAAEGIKDWAVGKAARGPAGWSGRQFLRSKTARATARALVRVPGFRGAGAALANRIASEEGLSESAVKKYREQNLKNLPEASDVYAFSKSPLVPKALTRLADASAAAELAERGKLDDVLKVMSPDKRNNTISVWLKAAQMAGVDSDILKTKPDWAPVIGKDIGKVTGKIDRVDKISLDSLRNVDVVSSFSEAQLKKITAEQKKVIKETMRIELDKLKQSYKIPETHQILKDLQRLTKKELQVLAKQQSKTEEEIMREREVRTTANQHAMGISDKDFNRLKALINIKRASLNPTWQT